MVSSVSPSPLNSSPGYAEGFLGWVTYLVHRHRARLVGIARREGLYAEDALDCVQETFVSFLKLPQARLLVDLPHDSARMLTVLVRNAARNRRRRHDYAKPHVAEEFLESLPSDLVSSDEVIIQAEQYALALGCLSTLDEVQQSVVNLRLVDELPGEDVALQLGTTRDHVGVLLFRAKRRLQRCLGDHGDRSSRQGAGAPAPKRERAKGKPRARPPV
jgi:RNA polymerase sigma-70 factor (ECF subfamily)